MVDAVPLHVQGMHKTAALACHASCCQRQYLLCGWWQSSRNYNSLSCICTVQTKVTQVEMPRNVSAV